MFGEKLEKYIKLQYESKAKYAEVCNISQGHLVDLIKGRTLPREDNLTVLLNNLKLSNDEKIDLMEEWGYAKTGNIFKDKITKLTKENKDMHDVLEKFKSEKEMLKEIENMKNYEEFYNNVFAELTEEESQEVLGAISDKLKLIAMNKGKFENMKDKFDRLDESIKKI